MNIIDQGYQLFHAGRLHELDWLLKERVWCSNCQHTAFLSQGEARIATVWVDNMVTGHAQAVCKACDFHGTKFTHAGCPVDKGYDKALVQAETHNRYHHQ